MVIVIDSKVIRDAEEERYNFVYDSLKDSFHLYGKDHLKSKVTAYGENMDGIRPMHFEINTIDNIFSVYKECYFDTIFKLAEEYESKFGIHALIKKDFTW